MLQKSESINELATALSKAQGEIKHATKDSINPAFKFKYADLTNVLSAAKDVLSKHGLAVVQGLSTDTDRNIIHCETIILHASGQWISDLFSLKPTKTDPQGFGSAATYARRYSLASMLGIGQEDDDGNAASSKDDSCKNDNSKDDNSKDNNARNSTKKSSVYTGADYQKQILIDICSKKGLSDEQFVLVEEKMMNQPSVKIYEIIESIITSN